MGVRKFVDRRFSRTVPPELLGRLLAPFEADIGFDVASLPKNAVKRGEHIFEFFRSSGDLPDQLLNALNDLKLVANDEGVRILLEQAALHKIILIPPEEIEDPLLCERQIALRAYLDHRHIFERTVDTLAYRSPRSSLELCGREEGVLPDTTDAAQQRFRDAVAAYFASRYQGRYCDVRWYPEGDHLNLIVLHGENVRTTLVEEAAQEKVRSFRVIRQDMIRYDGAAGRIQVSAKSDTERKQLAALFAETLLGRPDFFAAYDAHHLYTLSPIAKAGAAFSLSRAWDQSLLGYAIREIQIDDGEVRPDGKLRHATWAMTVRHVTNAVRQLARTAPSIQLAKVRINYVKLEFRFASAGKPRRIMVKIKPPGVVSFRKDLLEPLIMEHLRRNGLCIDRPAASSAAAD